MHFTTYLAAAVIAATAFAAEEVKVHIVKVSAADTNKLTFSPWKLEASVGEMIQFQFGVGAHTVTQSTFDNPCVPVGFPNNLTGIHSGSMPVKAGDEVVPTYTVAVKDDKPMWLYCATGKHCQGGMVMVVNENTSKNATRSLENYKVAAALAPENISPDSPKGGEAGTGADAEAGEEESTGGEAGYGGGSYGGGPSKTWTTSAGAGATGAPRPSGTVGDVTATGTDGVPSSTFTGAAGKVYAPAMAGIVAIGAALLL